jgi:EAL domain-containing protein (putative c-di-GMP-specific phosphodiesterase class I)
VESVEERAHLDDPTEGMTVGLRTVFQPIVDIETRVVVAVEALTRGPEGTLFESPDALFAEARRTGTVDALDRACQRTAISSFLALGAAPDLSLFVNLEPATITRSNALDLARFVATLGSAQVVVELTERAISSDPAGLIAGVHALRAVGLRVAIDDVGADPASLALLPFIEPDVIKLDIGLLRSYGSSATARILLAVRAEAERSGALVLAEGVETEADVDRALVMGATHAQGWLFGRPVPEAPISSSSIVDRITRRRMSPDLPPTPFALVTGDGALRRSTARLLLPMSRYIEQRAMTAETPAVVLGAFQIAERFSPHTRGRYERLAAVCALVGAIGVDLSPSPGLGIRGASIEKEHPLAGEWAVVVVSTDVAIALVARESDTYSGDEDRTFDYLITHDRARVLEVGALLLSHLVPETAR